MQVSLRACEPPARIPFEKYGVEAIVASKEIKPLSLANLKTFDDVANTCSNGTVGMMACEGIYTFKALPNNESCVTITSSRESADMDVIDRAPTFIGVAGKPKNILPAQK